MEIPPWPWFRGTPNPETPYDLGIGAGYAIALTWPVVLCVVWVLGAILEPVGHTVNKCSPPDDTSRLRSGSLSGSARPAVSKGGGVVLSATAP
jgi:hypothetical protein